MLSDFLFLVVLFAVLVGVTTVSIIRGDVRCEVLRSCSLFGLAASSIGTVIEFWRSEK